MCAEVRTPTGRKRLDGDWKALRRGWCLGSDEFRDRMIDRLDKILQGKSRSAYAGPAIREHGERAARAWAGRALIALELGKPDLERTKKNDLRKQVVAWWLRKHTTMTNRWIAELLHMGHEVNVSHAARRVEEGWVPELESWRKRLCKILKS